MLRLLPSGRGLTKRRNAACLLLPLCAAYSLAALALASAGHWWLFPSASEQHLDSLWARDHWEAGHPRPRPRLLSSRGRHASGYLHYVLSQEGPVVGWYENLVPKHSADDTYFAVDGHSFGYSGLQQVRDWPSFQGKLIFSIWDQGHEATRAQEEAVVVECGQRSICSRFGGEGTGAKSVLDFDEWKVESPYSFITIAQDVGNDRVRCEGYAHVAELGGWNLVSKIEVRRGSRPPGLANLYSFVEQWSTEDFESARWAKLGPSFVRFANGEWEQVRSARFSHTKAPGEALEHVNANVTNHGMQWGLGIGGQVNHGLEGKVLTVDEQPVPDDLKEFAELMAADELPVGCLGRTCDEMETIAVKMENFLRSPEGRTGGIVLVMVLVSLLLVVACMLLCICLGGAGGRRKPSTRGFESVSDAGLSGSEGSEKS